MLFVLLALAMAARLWAQEVEPASPPERPAAASPGYIEHEFYLPDPTAMPRGLDALEVRAIMPGRHPLALLTHGTSKNPQDRATVTPWAFLPQALWFARRGYVVLVVVRRGYGRSGGEMDGRHGGCGRNGSFTQAGEASAEDLRAAARYAATLPEVDTATVISAGVSTGGFAQVALSADPMPGLKAAISFAGGRGGDGTGRNCDSDGLEHAFHGFGKHNRVPMLWIYAENDKWFPPELARRLDEEFRKGGGTDEFVMAPPDGEDGHHFFYNIAKWSPIVEGYLRGKDLLPFGDQVLPPPALPNVPEPPGLGERGAEAFRHFLMNGPFKAFATNGAGIWGSSTGQFAQDIADRKALEHCKAAAKGIGACVIVTRGPQ
ncbi:MAG: CocE/NonD family hydrolase [Bryobacteraceae bacterium]